MSGDPTAACRTRLILCARVPPHPSPTLVSENQETAAATDRLLKEEHMATHTIVLAHGILGFGSIPRVPLVAEYFNGVAPHLRKQGHTVFATTVNPIGGVVERGEQLAAAILAVPLEDGQKLHVIAHSMGGLDARQALSNIKKDGISEQVAARVKTLVTIGTPHRGSPVADAIANGADDLLDSIPPFFADALKDNAAGLKDLTAPVAIPFDESTPDVDDVCYIEVAGDASLGGKELILFQLAAAIGRIHDEINDGVVTESSALRPGHKHLEDWPTDHAGEIGWSYASPVPINRATLALIEFGRLPMPPHLAWYDKIVAMFDDPAASQ
jgi:triacylglycerol lipase